MVDGTEHAPADFAGLAARAVGGIEGAGCVIATRDGLVLGAYPEGEERRIFSRWAGLGPGATAALRGFLVLGREAWAITTTRRYVAVAIVPTSTRPGLALERLEAALEEAEGGGASERPPGPVHAARAPAASPRAQRPGEPEGVSPDVLEVAKVLGRLADRPAPDPADDRWSVTGAAGTIGA